MLDQDKPGAVVLWPESRATARRVFSDTSTALFRDDFVYSARSFGEFVCVDAKTGKQVWETDQVTNQSNSAIFPGAFISHSSGELNIP